MTSTRSALPGDVITIIDKEANFARRLHVMQVTDDGLSVVYYTPEGIGPFAVHLPHTAQVERTLYLDESAGQHRSHWSLSD